MSNENALKQYIKATNTHNFENVKQLLHPKAVYWFSDRTCTSMNEIQHYFEDSWDTIKDEYLLNALKQMGQYFMR